MRGSPHEEVGNAAYLFLFFVCRANRLAWGRPMPQGEAAPFDTEKYFAQTVGECGSQTATSRQSTQPACRQSIPPEIARYLSPRRIYIPAVLRAGPLGGFERRRTRGRETMPPPGNLHTRSAGKVGWFRSRPLDRGSDPNPGPNKDNSSTSGRLRSRSGR